MKISETLTNWLAKNKLTWYQLLSITFVPRRTAEDILKGERRLAATYRFYTVTGLDEFKLSGSDMEEYESSKKNKPVHAMDELICKRFANEFFTTGDLPSVEDALVINQEKYKDKKVLTKTLTEKYFSGKAISRTASKGVITGSVLLGSMVHELHYVLTSTEADIQAYKQKNKDGLRQLRGLVEVLFDENPGAAYKKLLSTENIFS